MFKLQQTQQQPVSAGSSHHPSSFGTFARLLPLMFKSQQQQQQQQQQQLYFFGDSAPLSYMRACVPAIELIQHLDHRLTILP